MNQNYYLPALRLALKDAASNGITWKPQALFDILKKQNSPLEYVSNGGWECNQLFAILDEDLGFVQRARFGTELTADEYKRLANVVRWLRKEIECFEFSNDVTLAVILLVAVQLADGRTLWREIVFKQQPNSFLEKLHWLLGRFACKFTMRSEQPPIWETEAMTTFEKANQLGDFIHIETAWRQISGALLPSIIQQSASTCLLYHDFPKLLAVSHKLKDVVVAAHTISALPTNQMLLLATMSESSWVKFAALFVLCHKRARSRGWRLNKYSEKHLTDLIVSISMSEEHWRQFIIAFNRYPSRYPVLHTSLGYALAHLSEAHWKIYLSSFEATDSHARPFVSQCMQAFYETAVDKARKIFFTMVYAKWNEEVRGKKDDQYHFFDLFVTSLDFGVVVYLVELGGIELIENQVTEIRQAITNLQHMWYPSVTEAISAYNKLVSLLQVYYHAVHVVSEGKSFLFEKFFVPQDIYENRYLSLSFPSHWHERL
jgi:hypothetical protein